MSEPRTVTIERLESLIVAEEFLTPAMSPTVTICVLTLQNGFSLIGHSACVDPRNYDQAIGCRIARADALENAWPLEGYLLAQRMHEEKGSAK